MIQSFGQNKPAFPLAGVQLLAQTVSLRLPVGNNLRKYQVRHNQSNFAIFSINFNHIVWNDDGSLSLSILGQSFLANDAGWHKLWSPASWALGIFSNL